MELRITSNVADMVVNVNGVSENEDKVAMDRTIQEEDQQLQKYVVEVANT